MLATKNCIAILSLIAWLPGFSQAEDSTHTKEGRFRTSVNVLKNSILSIPGDFKEMGHSISGNWKKTAAYTGGIAGLVMVDKYTTEFYQDNIEDNIKYSLPRISSRKSNFPLFQGNDAYITYSLLGIYGGSIIANNEKGQIAAINSFKALAYSYVISHLVLKTLFGRQRPDPALSDGIPPESPFTSNPLDFGNFHGVSFDADADGTAFPSLHATAYFAVAKVLAMEFNNYWIPYTLVSVVFFADIKNHRHWVADMVAGGLIGTLIGKAIVVSSRKLKVKEDSGTQQASLRKRASFQLVPQISGRMVGLHCAVTF
ncbi:phosphatase PAP2 family protein [Sinomicrobium weinanense]|uniref:Phosphatase PAP2 family protein n=1 Tax=Sinomicrobium weinanense TaxID=2842200 RepID=A0A926JQ98_9FLAO|nr:phosphatase PAP2 family protein [Sinomicrobium weinanense]MBC9795344.1 phosphatase PAP2 family protein [Sinomicrobium weinanense]MBU3122941.1 phosphatase PAP2 family protein [Sinomicrobium weinanense]